MHGLCKLKIEQVKLASVFTTQMHHERVVPVYWRIKSLLLDVNWKFWRALNTLMEENTKILKLDTPLDKRPSSIIKRRT